MQNPIGYDLLFKDEMIRNAGAKAKKKGTELDALLDNFVRQLDIVLSQAVMEGNAYTNLKTLRDNIKKTLDNEIKTKANSVKNQASVFVTYFDEADADFF
jgi:hypothetical protein